MTEGPLPDGQTQQRAVTVEPAPGDRSKENGMQTEAAPKFDPTAPEFLADPYPTYERLRAAAPVCRGGIAQWVVPRYAEVAALLRDPRLSHEFPDLYRTMALGDGPAGEFVRRVVLSREGSDHESLRRLLHR